LAIDLAFHTGHRIGAILALRWDDITLETPTRLHGEIRWRADTDKKRREHSTPISQDVSAALRATLERTATLGSPLLFPREQSPELSVERHVANRWLRRAEDLACLDHVPGSGFHAFRRGFASARKHHPDVDVAAAGGWKDIATMKESYQHADPVGVLAAVTQPNYSAIA